MRQAGHSTIQVTVATVPALEQAPHRMQQLLELDRRIFAPALSDERADLGVELQRSKTVRVALALHHTTPDDGKHSTSTGDVAEGTPPLLGYAVYCTNSLTAHVVKVAVAPQARRQGIATALLHVSVQVKKPHWAA